MFATALSNYDTHPIVYEVRLRLREYGYSEPSYYRDPYYPPPFDREEFNQQRRAACCNIAGVPPVDLPLCTRPLPHPRAPVQPPRQPGLTRLTNGRESKPYRARHRTLIRRRAL